MTLTPLAGWFASYLVHSTVLAGLALAACAVLRGPRARVALLRGALIGGLVTATLAGRLGTGPALALPVSVGASGSGQPIMAQGLQGDTAVPAGGAEAALPVATSGAKAPTTSSNGREAAGPRSPLAWPGVLLALLSAAGLVRLIALEARARRALSARRPATSPELDAAQDRVGLAGSEVRMSECTGLSSPLALGRAEVVLPEGLLGALPAPERQALLAHELAHLARRDPLWLGVARVVLAITWFQPLQHVLMARLLRETEFAADARAAGDSDASMDLARCLERVAVRLASQSTPAASAAMTVGRSVLVERVERLVARRKPESERAAWAAVAVSTVLLVGLACAGPSVSGEAADQRDPQGVEEAEIASVALVSVELALVSTEEGVRARFWDEAPVTVDAAIERLSSSDVTELRLSAERGVAHADLLRVFEAAMAAGWRDIRFDDHPVDGANLTELHERLALARRQDEAATAPSKADVRLIRTEAGVAVQLEGGGVAPVDEVIDWLLQLRTGGRTFPINISAAEDVPYAEFAALADAVIGAGFTNVNLVDGAGEPFETHQWLERYDIDAQGNKVKDGYILRIAEDGSWEGAGDGAPSRKAAVARLRSLSEGMPREAVSGLTLPSGQLTLRAHHAADFGHILDAMAACAHPEVQLWRISLAAQGAPVLFTDVSLPLDLEDIPEEIEEGSEVEPVERPHLRVVRGESGKVEYFFGPRKMTERADVLRSITMALNLDKKRAPMVSVEVRDGVTVGDVLPTLHELRELGIPLTFTGRMPGRGGR